jgi:hypothetical protein
MLFLIRHIGSPGAKPVDHPDTPERARAPIGEASGKWGFSGLKRTPLFSFAQKCGALVPFFSENAMEYTS